ncbi:MAG: galactose ABC transporter substrate-binding protein [Oscillospiraceae bacterium]|jgi:methyl-galactoside transport system substrate-binding protein|nr:galactose ABC transporter substrate-binding protein [Oscillospiraceae bacterium]
MWKKVTVLCCAALLLLGTGGCGDNQTAPEQTARIKIGLTLYRQDDTFISLVRGYIETAAREREAQDDVKITLNITDGRSNQSEQNEQVDRFLQQGYDVICVNEVDRTAAAVIIDKAKTAGIPIVFFNREPVEEDMQRWENLYYVGSDPKESGTFQGNFVAELYADDPERLDKNGDGRLQYVLLEGEPGHQDAALRTEYFIKTLNLAGVKIEKLANGIANWQRSQGLSKMSLWIEELGDRIEVVFSNNDDMALGAIDAYKAAGYTDEMLPVIVGIDGTPPALEAVRAGTLTATVLNDAEGQGRAIFELAYALARGLPVEETGIALDGHYVWVPHRIITAETME